MAQAVLRGLRCVRCGERAPLRYDTSGCPACREQGVPSALLADYDLSDVDGSALWDEWARRRPALWSHRELLPVDADKAISLAEGGTPLVELPERVTGAANRTLVKDERRNPTGSFKDRFYSIAVSWAAASGASTVAVASSGNAGVSVAAYAAAAGLDCVVVTTETIERTWRGRIERHGARPVFARDAADRWRILRERAAEQDWTVLTNTSATPVSSLWAGIDGYKTMAYEIVRDLGDVPEVVTVPVSRGDGLAGMWAGFRELHELGIVERLPRMVAAERYPSLSRALAAGADLPPEEEADLRSIATSIGDPRATVMSLRVLRESGGAAVPCGDEDLQAAVRRLGSAGVGAEPSSAAGLVAIDELRRREWLRPDDRVVTLVTSRAANQPSTLPDPARH
ncbi:threonine synthase [Halopolyspora algeriensis]|uniref:Threonine synthase n=1 Tax=Halopolyspora algeriensis TaxID=1500506 RepID=A0A368VM42_9ACTN|nr:pyridoxal-phosphate dependent enzyme [Halopolyspora algeriensis]RCW42769.1 threonine synthase [Halopolyspora algeriensis]TQM56761.1 threonine synthase [Halopolyspora algeriensis]